MDFLNNPEYKVAHTCPDGTNIYIPVDMATGYHISRKIAAEAQNIYASGGADRKVLEGIMNEILDRVNSDKYRVDRVKSDVAVLANNILYRLKYPLDQDCAIRMGAIYTFLDGEDPKVVSTMWTEKKVELARKFPDTYTFFLTIGIELIPSYKESLTFLEDRDYFRKRTEIIRSLTPPND